MDLFVGVPDSLLKPFCGYIEDHCDRSRRITTANEGNAIAIASGYHLSANKYGVVYMQNSGIGNAVNPLLSLADEEVYSIPMLLIIGWRGEPGTKDEPQHIKQGKTTISLLEAMGIEYRILDSSYKIQIEHCHKYMKENNKPIALIVKKDTFSEYKEEKKTNGYFLTRERSLEVVLDKLHSDEYVVSTTGKTSREIFEIRERKGQGHANDFLTVGSMGHTASIAYGLSIGTDKNVYCIDGDGSFLMHMGGLAVIAYNCKSNFKYIMINNGAHESVGGQSTVAFSIDVEKILSGMGFKNIYIAKTEDDIIHGMELLANEELNALIIYTKQGSRDNLGRPVTTPVKNKNDLMKQIKQEKYESDNL